MLKLIKTTFLSIHYEGYKFIIIFFTITLILFLIWNPLGWIGFILTLWCIYFFRDPKRIVPTNDNLVVSPADGTINLIKIIIPPKELNLNNKEMLCISIFMNIFNVHVNRMPMSGEIIDTFYIPGKFLNASLNKSSSQNERQIIKLKTKNNLEIGIVQIAGIIARRILCEARKGDIYKKGQRFGLIRFGSRLDIYVPKKYKNKVAIGQTVIAGETILFNLNDNKTELNTTFI